MQQSLAPPGTSVWDSYPVTRPDLIVIAGPEIALKPLEPVATMVSCIKLPNPFNEPHLRERDGLEADVRNWLLDKADVQTALSGLQKHLTKLVASKQPNSLPTIVVTYCVGGHHRSPALGYTVCQLLASTTNLDIMFRRVPYKGSGQEIRETYTKVTANNLFAETTLIARWVRGGVGQPILTGGQ